MEDVREQILVTMVIEGSISQLAIMDSNLFRDILENSMKILEENSTNFQIFTHAKVIQRIFADISKTVIIQIGP